MDDKAKEIKEALHEYQEAYSEEYDQMRDDLTFASGEQWETEDADRLNLVVDQIEKHCNRIVNPIRIHPFGFGVQADASIDPIQASRLNAFLARIQQDCGAYSIYADRADISIRAGRSFAIIGDDWRTGDGIEKKIVITAPKDDTCVFLDPTHEAIDGSDSENAGLIASLGKDRAKRIYGIDYEDNKVWDALPSGFNLGDDCIPLISYWKRASETKKMVWIQTESGIIAYDEATIMQLGPIPVDAVVGVRDIRSTYVNFWQMAGNEIITDSRIESPYIPVVPFYSYRKFKNEGGLKTEWRGLVDKFRDQQKLANLAFRGLAERLDMAPKAPYIAEVDQITFNEDVANSWDRMNQENRAVYFYKHKDGVQPPFRADQNPHTTEMFQTYQGIVQGMTNSLGMGDADFGGRGAKEQSGYAMSLMQETSDYQTAGPIQNWEQSVIQIGRIVLAMAPGIYSDGVEVQYDLPNGQGKASGRVMPDELKGNLKVCVTTSASYAQRKKQGNQLLVTLAGQNPEFAAAFAYDILKSSDADISEEALERAKKMIPAHLSGEGPDPAALQTMQQQQVAMDSMAKTIEQYEAIISQLQSKIIGDTQKAELTLQGKIIDSQTQIVLQQMKNDGKLDEAQVKTVEDIVKQIFTASTKTVELDKGPVNVEFTSPMDTFVPMAPGPLVIGTQEDNVAGLPNLNRE